MTIDLQSLRARAKARVRPCEGGADHRCGAPSTVKCTNSECSLERCDEHADTYSMDCDHN